MIRNNFDNLYGDLLWIDDSKKLQGILGGESGELFMRFLKKYLRDLFSCYLNDFPSDIPEDFLLHHLSGSFAEAIKWWMMEDTKHSPEEIASYFMISVGK